MHCSKVANERRKYDPVNEVNALISLLIDAVSRMGSASRKFPPVWILIFCSATLRILGELYN